MQENQTAASAEGDRHLAQLAVATQLLTALFRDQDTIVVRPMEIWTSNNCKESRVDYGLIRHFPGNPEQFQVGILQRLQLSEKGRLNLLFGVCPRFGGGGQFELAWQIRTIRTLWVDIDNVSIAEAAERMANGKLPKPSILVNSGNGVHAYWLLEEPYLIDDVGDPPPIETEWVEGKAGPNRPRKYFMEDGERIYLHGCRHARRVSPKGRHAQDLLAGIANACGGDHATDLSRLLRLAGSYNRKDERNGQAPKMTELVECNSDLRFPISAFEPFKVESPDSARERKIAAIPLATPRKSLSPSRADKLGKSIARSANAQEGSRSEADFALCCCAIRDCIAREDLWGRVEKIGKFAEAGRDYFDRTWDKAEYEVRASKLESFEKRHCKKSYGHISRPADGSDGGDPPPTDGEEDKDDIPTIYVDQKAIPIAQTLSEITDHLLETNSCFIRADQLVDIHDETIETILASQQLSGLLSQYAEIAFGSFESEDNFRYKPLPHDYADAWLHNRIERSRFPKITLYTRNPIYTKDWRVVSPGYDTKSRIYYAGPPVEIRDDTSKLDTLLHDFCFATEGDRSNFVGMLLTAIVMPQFIGSKPAVLFNGNQPGVGKTMMAQLIAIVRDGHPATTASYNPNDEEFEKHMGAIVRGGATTVIVDNAKGRGRSRPIDSPCLERSITDRILSFRLLNHSKQIRAENSHIFCITANAPDVSRDLVTRCVVVELRYEGDPKRRSFSIADPETFAEKHRLEILGELMGMVEKWKAAGSPRAQVHTRFSKQDWGGIIGGILEVCGRTGFLANADEAASIIDATRREFAELVAILIEDPHGVWSASKLVELCQQHELLAVDLGNGKPRSLATRMGTIASRFVNEVFPVDDEHHAIFQKAEGRKGALYRVSVRSKLPNVDAFAEPSPNVQP